MTKDGTERIDGRRAKGDASRRVALSHARTIALVDGLEGLTFGRVAHDSGIAKSSLQILFGDRRSLQLQTLESGVEDFARQVTDVVAGSRDREKRPLKALCDAWFSVAGRTDCGGCLLTSAVAEFSAKAGPVSEAVLQAYARWRQALRDAADRALACGEVASSTDLDQLVFEILALQSAANSNISVADEKAPSRAARAVQERIARAKADIAGPRA